MTRKEPYQDKDTMQIVLQVVNNGLRPTIPPEFLGTVGRVFMRTVIPFLASDCPMVPLIRDCWNQEPDRRPIFRIVRDRLLAIERQTGMTDRWA